ncbi:Gfo/Idh/MocA family protein [Plantactinospora sp. CA-294935]|uniref:Gfo/Idh/MocA family protein n=1 Tax=Plantactinospora sp. CA-294935 TaxID=3240012 RepID=UPI003D903949
MSNLKAGIIGCGQMGRNHAVAYQTLTGVDLVAAHDHDDRSADRFCADFDIKPATLPELLELVDIVSICTWPSSHSVLTLEALSAGTHVLCEKPPAANAEEATKMLEMAEEQGLVLTYGLLYRHAFRGILDVVADVGRPYKITAKWLRRFGFPKWSPTGYRESSGGALTDLGVHMIDLALYLVGCPEPELVHAAAWNHRAQEFSGELGLADRIADPSYPDHANDSAFVLMQLDNGCTAMVEVAYSTDMTEDEHVSVEIQGSHGTLVLPVPTTQAVFSPGLLPKFHRSDERASSSAVIQCRPRLVREAVHDQLANFRDVVLGVQSPVITASEAVTVQRILDLAACSARTGDPVTLKGNDEAGDLPCPKSPTTGVRA